MNTRWTTEKWLCKVLRWMCRKVRNMQKSQRYILQCVAEDCSDYQGRSCFGPKIQLWFVSRNCPLYHCLLSLTVWIIFDMEHTTSSRSRHLSLHTLGCFVISRRVNGLRALSKQSGVIWKWNSLCREYPKVLEDTALLGRPKSLRQLLSLSNCITKLDQYPRCCDIWWLALKCSLQSCFSTSWRLTLNINVSCLVGYILQSRILTMCVLLPFLCITSSLDTQYTQLSRSSYYNVLNMRNSSIQNTGALCLKRKKNSAYNLLQKVPLLNQYMIDI